MEHSFFSPYMTLAIVGALTVASTFLGGLFALRVKDKLHLVLGFSAGAIIGVVFFDLLPEAIALGSRFSNRFRLSTDGVLCVVVVGFACYMILDRTFTMHRHTGLQKLSVGSYTRGDLGAGSLSLHSFLDGAAIGIAFQATSAIGFIVAVAVLVHDFSDGMNTVNLVLKSGGGARRALKWLCIDALAPVLGIMSTLFIVIPAGLLAPMLAFISGSFLYISASELIPESHHTHPTKVTTFVTLCGMAIMYAIIRLLV